MEIKSVDYRGKKVIVLSGEIDMYSSPVLRKELMGLVDKKLPVLAFDFREVSYIDSSGIATFVEGLKAMKSYGGRLRFFGIQGKIMEVFSFSKLDKVFEIYESRDEAFKK